MIDTKTETVTSKTCIEPPATIGMVGGGQLGRMFAHAATMMGYRVIVFCQSADDPAAQVTSGCVVGELSDRVAVEEFARQCDVITLEFENIPAETIRLCSQHAATYPSHDVLAIAQHRILEKSTLRDVGLPVTPFSAVHDTPSLIEAAKTWGWPVIVKTAESGYDGKGQYRVDDEAGAGQIPWPDADSWVAEKCIAFEREISVVVARRTDGAVKCFEPFENDHRNHILDVTSIPAAITPALAARAEEIAKGAAEALDVVGLLCVEMFVIGSGEIFINEVAPRPHNSGHLTIEACATSQFQQHVRAVCSLPLGDTRRVVGAAAMVNLLGDVWNDDGSPPDWSKALEVPAVNLHLYGKQIAKKGRKMGHLTAVGGDAETAIQAATTARARLEG